MFADGKKGKIQGVGSIDRSEQPYVYLVEGLKSNLISISQMCDEGLMVMFTKIECRAVDEEGKVRLSKIRTGSNYYMWRSTYMVGSTSQQTSYQNSAKWKVSTDKEFMELSRSQVWKPQAYLKCLQCCDDLTHEHDRFRGTKKSKHLQHE